MSELGIENNVYTEDAFMSKSPNPQFDMLPMRYIMFHVYGKHKNNLELRQRYKLNYWA